VAVEAAMVVADCGSTTSGSLCFTLSMIACAVCVDVAAGSFATDSVGAIGRRVFEVDDVVEAVVLGDLGADVDVSGPDVGGFSGSDTRPREWLSDFDQSTKRRNAESRSGSFMYSM
jgi:hypothetical protein